ncbi:DeoR/GlpR family DNA-binding transcription regulator [Paenibacillus sacheonensis]|uniref:DeoR family transcriptional regulator n=1 Tax=Paenibacillus sacheonensis TaxID=742054 RepID=A0A7X4YJG8_9BACL|nr:DeoR/GlpR family DNA-binding transcription regulator [Paenibacillus sacheonensis]MBM7564269.1 DeoR/GlpR family transcriptional regulator of sugar metabolism [Paenibacillus sacheonensis]NBC67408.1 DeoR family transcriptional regulator [Paenibacillus sacheonensis]
MSLAGEERKRSIMALLNENGKVNVIALSQQFEVSTETIRRDLDELEKDNKLKKVYGGAVKLKSEIEPAYYEREVIHADEKRVIGALAAKLIEDDDVLVIDEGSTAMQILHHLDGKRNLTILVCSIPTLTLLVDYQKRGSFDGRIIFIGGEINTKHLRVSGPIAEKMMEDFYVNKSFVSVDGVSAEHGITGYDYERALFTRKLIRCSETVVVVADASKIGKRTVAKIADLSDVHYIVSNDGPPTGWEGALKEHGVKWVS